MGWFDNDSALIAVVTDALNLIKSKEHIYVDRYEDCVIDAFCALERLEDTALLKVINETIKRHPSKFVFLL